jgi:F0F1-type ATP synthase membrane subunit c/vacuolar-type H+-ATPase subunit K
MVVTPTTWLVTGWLSAKPNAAAMKGAVQGVARNPEAQGKPAEGHWSAVA